jgi:limonene-1,2-epoxide hydrolase
VVIKRSKGGSADPMQVVSRFLDAANHHDADALRACVHHNFESIQPIHPGRNFRGSGQLISNWKAIFEAEPGFRLTVLRSAAEDDTVWVEVHGAGDSAEAAGIFIVGVEDGRIRWIRVYSDLVEPAPPGVEPAPPLEVEAALVAEEEGAPEEAEAAAAPEEPAAALDDEHAVPAAVAVGEETDAFDRPLRLVDAGGEAAPAKGEPDGEALDDAGAAAALRLVPDEDGAGAESEEPEVDMEGVATGELLEVPSDEDEADEDDGAEPEVFLAPTDSAGTGLTTIGDSWESFGPTKTEEAGAALDETTDLTTDDEETELETTDGAALDETTEVTTDDEETAELETTDGSPLDETTEVTTEDEDTAELETTDGSPLDETTKVTPDDETTDIEDATDGAALDETADVTTDDEETAEAEAAEETVDVATDDETAEPEAAEDAALAETAEVTTDEEEPPEPDATEDTADADAPASDVDPDADQPDADEDEGGSGSPRAAGASGIPGLTEPTSPPLPRANPRRPAEEDKPAMRRRWRWMRNSSGH